MIEDLLDIASLDRLSRIHDADAVASLEDEAEIMRDIDHRRPEALRDVLDQLDHARFDGDIERGCRLIEQQELGIGQKRHRDDDPLLLAARQLMRIGVHDPLGIGKTNRFKQFRRALVGGFRRNSVMDHRHFDELVLDQHRRIERGHRLLIDHRYLRAADLAQLLIRHAAHVAPHETDLAAGDGAVPAHILHDGKRDGGLAAARFADDPDRFAGIDGEIEVVDRRDRTGAGVIGDRQVLAFENGRRGVFHDSIPERDFAQAVGEQVETENQR